jgi:hypothetical protein
MGMGKERGKKGERKGKERGKKGERKGKEIEPVCFVKHSKPIVRISSGLLHKLSSIS